VDFSEYQNAQPAGLQDAFNPIRVTRRDDAGIGYDQNDLRAQPAREFAHALHAVQAENDSRPRLVIERRK